MQYDIGMASITKKRINGKTYYYARECKRVNGKPKIVWQKYLGRADDVIAAVVDGVAPQPTEAVVTELGAVAALYDVAQRLKLVEHVDRHVKKAGSGPSVGTYLLIAALNRCVAPGSKASIGDWFAKTALRRLLDVEPRQLSSQRFWDNMNRVSHEDMVRIEQDVTAFMVREFAVDVRRVLFDATNFFTHIDSFNDRCELAQRGKSKEGREALRLIGLALLVSADGHVPLLHRTYPGNQPDAPTFASVTETLVARYRAFAEGCEHVTLVMDKGNNSKENLSALEKSPYHIVGSLVPTHHEDLLAIPASELTALTDEDFADVKVCRRTKRVFGAERTVLVTYNENLFLAQTKTLLREIEKRRTKLRELQASLRRWQTGKVRGRAPTAEGVRKKVAAWLKARHMKDLLRVDVGEEHGIPSLRYRFDERAWTLLQQTLLGKTILFTDNDGWADAEIVRAYRSQYHVEEAFKRLKDPHYLALRPQFHWTDQKIEVHVFCCVLALLLCSLLRRELAKKGINRSIPQMLGELGDVREVGVVYPPRRGAATAEPVTTVTLSHMSADQRAVFDALGLYRYAVTS